MSSPGPLDDEEFSRIVRCVPLISMDLIIRDPERKVFVGLRNNEPAKGCYFVPGGCIRKGEPLEDAFARIVQVETGLRAELGAAAFLGVHEHMYATNRFGHADYGTHYVVLAYGLNLDHRPSVVLDSQHCGFRWMTEAELKAAPDVHPYTKAYFGV
jgi:colanic acid biosynthesis protein WcaH